MKFNYSFFEVMMLVVIICTNLMFLEISLTNLILSLIIALIGFLGLFKKDMAIKPIYYFLLFSTLILIIVTRQLNQVSILIFLILYLFIMDKKDYDYLNIYLKFSIFFFVVIIMSYFLFGFNVDNDTTIWRALTGQTHPRSSLGFYHSNVAMMKWLAIVMAIYARVKREDILKISIIIGAATFFFYEVTLSRTSTIVIGVISVLMVLFRKSLDMEISRRTKNFLVLLPIIFMLVSLVLINMENVVWFNAILSGRLTIYYNAWSTYGLTLLGSAEVENLMFDNAYLHMLLSKGALFTIVYFTMFYLIIRKSKFISKRTTILIIGFLLTAIMETILLKFEFLTFILILLYQEELGNLKVRERNLNYQKELISIE